MTRSGLLTIAFAAFAVSACGVPQQEVEARIAKLEKKVEELEGEVEKGGGAAPAAQAKAKPSVDDAKEREAADKFRDVRRAHSKGDYDTVKKLIGEIEQNFPGTRAARAVKPLKEEVAVIGSEAIDLEVDQWFVGETSLDKGEATLIVFWEVWCPHCKREVPKLQQTWEKYQGKGLNMVALTRMTRDKSEAEVTSFLKESGVTYPVAKEDGKQSAHYKVRGIPAAAMVKDGKVVWRGHPGSLSEDMLEKFIGS